MPVPRRWRFVPPVRKISDRLFYHKLNRSGTKETVDMILQELVDRKIVRSKRSLSVLLGRAPNYVCETRGYFTAADLVEIRLRVIAVGGHDDLVAHLDDLILTSWRG